MEPELVKKLLKGLGLVVLSVVVAWALYFVGPPGDGGRENSGRVAGPAVTNGAGVNDKATGPNATPPSKPAQTVSDHRTKVVALHRNAMALRFRSDRDAALKKAIDFAIQVKELEAALPLVADLQFDSDKDEAYEKLIETSIRLREFDTAERIIPLLQFKSDQDAYMEALIKSRISSPP